jgi:hypothetical protein
MPDGCESAFKPVRRAAHGKRERAVRFLTRNPFRVDFGHSHRRLPEREAALAF